MCQVQARQLRLSSLLHDFNPFIRESGGSTHVLWSIVNLSMSLKATISAQSTGKKSQSTKLLRQIEILDMIETCRENHLHLLTDQ